MPRFYFHVFNDDTVLDEEGQELADLAAAHACAIREARALMGDTLRTGRIVLSHHIGIEDDAGNQVCNVTFGEAVEIRP